MRKIKFRGQSLTSNDWFYGLPASSNKDGVIDMVNGDYVKIHTVGQYTGLIDRFDVEVYEGDILRWTINDKVSISKIRTAKVLYVAGWWWCTGYVTDKLLAELIIEEKCKVVGNIHDSPEILKP